ncbi:MAG: thioredoxin family protein [Methanobacterium sp.]|nr:thioredoxin family protein [Methanobacterium sp.]
MKKILLILGIISIGLILVFFISNQGQKFNSKELQNQNNEQTDIQWNSDVNAAITQAKKVNKTVLRGYPDRSHKFKDLDTRKKDLDTRKKDLDTLKKDLDTRKKDLDTLKEDLDTRKKDLDTLKEDLDICKKNLDIKKRETNDPVNWSDLNATIKYAKKINKKILIEVYSTRCPSCRDLHYWTLNNKIVKEKLDDYIFLPINGPKNRELVDSYNIGGYPTLMVLDTDGNIIKAHLGFMYSTNFFKWLNFSSGWSTSTWYSNWI